MGTLKTTLKVESTDLFPTPVSFTTVNNNSINGTYSGFTTLTVTGGTAVTLSPVAPGVVGCYLYVSAPSTNTENIILSEATTSVVFGQLLPGDVGFFPIGDGTGFNLDADTESGTGSAVINYFIGLRV